MAFFRGSPRVWLYRSLVLIAAALVVVSFAMPWWTVDVKISGSHTGVQIYGYGLRHNLMNLRMYIAADETPAYQTALAWGFAGLISVLALLSAFIKGWRGRLLLGGAGLAYAAYATVAVFVVVANRVPDFNVAFTGWSTDTYADIQTIDVTYFSSIGAGYYLASAAGGLCLVLALARGLISGRT